MQPPRMKTTTFPEIDFSGGTRGKFHSAECPAQSTRLSRCRRARLPRRSRGEEGRTALRSRQRPAQEGHRHTRSREIGMSGRISRCAVKNLRPECRSSGPMHPSYVSRLISHVTLQTTGVDVSPHLFRTAAASTAAAYGSNPHLASALLNHRDPRVADKHYKRQKSIQASKDYATITESYTPIPSVSEKWLARAGGNDSCCGHDSRRLS